MVANKFWGARENVSFGNEKQDTGENNEPGIRDFWLFDFWVFDFWVFVFPHTTKTNT